MSQITASRKNLAQRRAQVVESDRLQYHFVYKLAININGFGRNCITCYQHHFYFRAIDGELRLPLPNRPFGHREVGEHQVDTDPAQASQSPRDRFRRGQFGVLQI
jgi:hypothetical protein